jgi:FtsP/CotA-like multicopper oxidase with cupredoxin domain
VLNSSAITYIDLQVLFNDVAQSLGVVALDGVPVNQNGNDQKQVVWKNHVLLPPAGRAEIRGEGSTRRYPREPGNAVRGQWVQLEKTIPRARWRASLLRPTRPATIQAANSRGLASPSEAPQEKPRRREHGSCTSPRNSGPKNPNGPTVFYLTVAGRVPTTLRPKLGRAQHDRKQGDVEDWVIENRSQELHAFHIHQIHFQLMEWNGVPVDEPYLRDTINVAYWDGKSSVYPSVKLRMDFRDRSTIGTFVYHCHVLEHEDGGMMGTIRVQPPPQKPVLNRKHYPLSRLGDSN